MMSTTENYRARSGRAPFVVLVLVSRLPPALREMAVEKGNERPLLWRVRLAAVARRTTRRRKCDRVAFVEVACDHHRMHVRLAADRRGISELRRDEPHRHGDVSLRFPLVPRRAELGKHRRGAQCSTPRPEILRAEVRREALVHIIVDVACGEIAPAPVGISIAEEAGAGRFELTRDQLRELSIDDDLPLLLVALAEVREHDDIALDGDVLLAQRRYAVGAVL